MVGKICMVLPTRRREKLLRPPSEFFRWARANCLARAGNLASRALHGRASKISRGFAVGSKTNSRVEKVYQRALIHVHSLFSRRACGAGEAILSLLRAWMFLNAIRI